MDGLGGVSGLCWAFWAPSSPQLTVFRRLPPSSGRLPPAFRPWRGPVFGGYPPRPPRGTLNGNPASRSEKNSERPNREELRTTKTLGRPKQIERYIRHARDASPQKACARYSPSIWRKLFAGACKIYAEKRVACRCACVLRLKPYDESDKLKRARAPRGRRTLPPHCTANKKRRCETWNFAKELQSMPVVLRAR